MAYILFTNGVVTAMSETAQPGIEGFIQVADDDPRLLAFLAPSPQDVAAALLASKIAEGIAITSTSTPALNGTYALDEVSAGQIYQIGLYASQLGTFPSGGMVQPYPDATGVPHNFTIAQFIAFLQAVAPLVSNLNNQAAVLAHGGPPSWPSQSAVIV